MMKPLMNLGLESQRVKKLISKLHVQRQLCCQTFYTPSAPFPVCTSTNSHQELVSGLISINNLFLLLSRIYTVLGIKA